MAAKPLRAGRLSRVNRPRRAASRKDRVPALCSKEWQSLPFGSPKRWLALAGTLTREEADELMASVQDLERVEER